MSAFKEGVPPEALDAALTLARAFAEGRPGLLGVGLGFKHSRVAGYGRKPRPCIKFLVPRKVARPAHAVPRNFRVGTERRSWLVPTDVETTGRPRLHAQCRARFEGAPGRRGSVGVFLESDTGERYVVTAGHVFLQGGRAVHGARVEIDGVSAGRTIGAHTRFVMDGAVLDVGIARLEEDVPAIAAAPWASLWKHLTRAEAVATVAAGRPLTYRMYGTANRTLAQFDSVYERAVLFPTLALRHAPCLVKSRALEGAFAPGDSGAPMTTDDGMFVGLHVFGGGPRSGESWAILAGSLVSALEHRLGAPLSLVGAVEG